MQPQLGSRRGLLEVYEGGQMHPQLGIWKRFIRSLLGVDRCSLSWGSGRGLLEVYQGWTDAASAGDLGRGLLEVYEGWTDAASAGHLEEV